MDVDLEDGEEDVVEEALLGHHTSHKKPLLGVSQRATIGRYAGLCTPARKDPPIRRRSDIRLKSCGRIFTPGGLPAISANQRRLSLFDL